MGLTSKTQKLVIKVSPESAFLLPLFRTSQCLISSTVLSGWRVRVQCCPPYPLTRVHRFYKVFDLVDVVENNPLSLGWFWYFESGEDVECLSEV